MDKNRFETQKEMVYLDYTNRHDSPQLYFTVDDLKWLITQAEKVERLEKENKSLEDKLFLLSPYKDIIFNQSEKIGRYEKAIEEFKKELDYEHGWQIQNAQGKSQWHKGCLEGFNHVQRIFSKHLK